MVYGLELDKYKNTRSAFNQSMQIGLIPKFPEYVNLFGRFLKDKKNCFVISIIAG